MSKLTENQLQVLKVLNKQKNPITLKTLDDKYGLIAVTNILYSLESRGFVGIRSEKGRNPRYFIKQAGKEVLKRKKKK